MADVDPDKALAVLRKDFPEDQIGKLPKVNCRNCSNAKGACDDQSHIMARCEVCRSWITTAHIHIDYVGHAEVTNRLLDADPTWSWRPMAFTPEGMPAFDHHGGLWIYLSVGGVERIGYGDTGGKGGANAIKEAIGDALRNAAMRFGVALNQWAKSDIHAPAEDDPEEMNASSEQINDILIKLGEVRQIRDRATIRQALRVIVGRPVDAPGELTVAEADLVLSKLRAEAAEQPPKPTGSQTVRSMVRGQQDVGAAS